MSNQFGQYQLKIVIKHQLEVCKTLEGTVEPEKGSGMDDLGVWQCVIVATVEEQEIT